MAFSVSGLSAYINESRKELLAQAQLSGKTAQFVTVQTNVKYKENLHYLESTVTFAAGNTCDDTSAGTTTLTARAIEVAPIKVVELLCEKDLLQKYLNAWMSAGSGSEMPTEVMAAVKERKAEGIAAALEVAIWQGDTGSGTANLAQFQGWLDILGDLGFGGAGDPIKGNSTDITTGTGIVASNIMTILDKQNSLVPTAVKTKYAGEITCFVGYDVFDTYTLKLRDLNLFHFAPTDGLEYIVHPGTRMKVVPVGGLDGTNQLVTTWPKNLVIGCDLESEELGGDIKEVNDKDYEGYKFKVEFKHGTQIAFPAEVVYFKLA